MKYKIRIEYNITYIYTKSENRIDIELLSLPVLIFPLSSDAEFTYQIS